LTQALQILQADCLPEFERLQDVRSRAITWGKIADIRQARGDLDEALRIYQEERLPVAERLGDVRGAAITWGKIADIRQAQRDLDEAVRIRVEEELPVYERLQDRRCLLVGRAKLGITLLLREGDGDRERAAGLLLQALEAAVAMQLPEAGQIAELMMRAGLAVPGEPPGNRTAPIGRSGPSGA